MCNHYGILNDDFFINKVLVSISISQILSSQHDKNDYHKNVLFIPSNFCDGVGGQGVREEAGKQEVVGEAQFYLLHKVHQCSLFIQAELLCTLTEFSHQLEYSFCILNFYLKKVNAVVLSRPRKSQKLLKSIQHKI